MFGLSNEERAYSKIFYERQSIARSQAKDLNVRIPQVFDLWFELLVEF